MPSAFDIFGAMGTALALLALVLSGIQRSLPQSQAQALLDLISRTEDYHETIKEDGLLQRLHWTTAIRVRRKLFSYRRDAEEWRDECYRAQNTFLWRYQIMFTRRAHKIEKLGPRVDQLRQLLRLYSTRQNNWEKQLVSIPGATQRLHIKQEFVLKMHRVLEAQKKHVDEAAHCHAHPVLFDQVYDEVAKSLDGAAMPPKIEFNDVLCKKGYIL